MHNDQQVCKAQGIIMSAVDAPIPCFKGRDVCGAKSNDASIKHLKEID